MILCGLKAGYCLCVLIFFLLLHPASEEEKEEKDKEKVDFERL